MNTVNRLRSSYAGIAATAALVLALTMGGAYAAGKIGAKKIATGAISSKHIKDGQVMSNDLASDIVVGLAKSAKTAETADVAGLATSAKTAETASVAERANTAETANTAGTATSAKSADVAASVTPNAVTGAGVADGSLGGPDLGDEAVTGPKLAQGSVGSQHIADGSVAGADLGINSVSYRQMAPASVAGTQFRTVTSVFGEGVPISGGSTGEARVECPVPSVLLAGGYEWKNAGASTIVYSAPGVNPRRNWIVRGFVPSGSNTLYAWATCLGS